jgi:hypothetical protein
MVRIALSSISPAVRNLVSLLPLMAAFAWTIPAATISTDFSITNGNPNGDWSYRVGAEVGTSTLLGLYTPTGSNPINPFLSTGYWGVGTNLDVHVPFMFRSLGDAGIFMTGDVVGHAPNVAGDYLFIVWTAPAAGTINSYSGSVWWGHGQLNRSVDFRLQHAGTLLESGTLTQTQDRESPVNFFDDAPFDVLAGDLVWLGFTKSSGQTWGALAGMDLQLNFERQSQDPGGNGTHPIPEPSTWLFMIAGLSLVALRRRK